MASSAFHKRPPLAWAVASYYSPPRFLQTTPQDAFLDCCPHSPGGFFLIASSASSPTSLSRSTATFSSSSSYPKPSFNGQFDQLSGQEDDSAVSSLSSSSSFCTPSTSDDEEDENAGNSSASSLLKIASSPPTTISASEGPLDTLSSLTAALPIKRGLSRHFSGKSQSFSSLARISSVTELAKPENPYVKRRRTAAKASDSNIKHHSYPPRCGSTSRIPKVPETCSGSNTLKTLPPLQTFLPSEGLSKCSSLPQF
ncbi:hypothetical protein KP509_28G043600 [Ceratopteris richardii]|uniref:Uncharacterized protein n=1 Tax=Ceratopteris richardii TaxID=49495 RepID=A0A8T2RD84_CERRI|nr:hypothetical protein KP509_28G043600 [Ceratopteris richardii]